jgi:hypothetical protein
MAAGTVQYRARVLSRERTSDDVGKLVLGLCGTVPVALAGSCTSCMRSPPRV